jgi:hypothetical protein
VHAGGSKVYVFIQYNMYGVLLLYLFVHYIGFCGYEGRRGRIYEERSDGVWNECSSVDAFLSQVLSPNICHVM